MRYDYQKVYEKHSSFWKGKESVLTWTSKICTAIFAFCYLALGVYLLCTKQTHEVLFVGLAFLACLICVQVLRIILNRKRPFEEKISPLVEKKKAGKSFPSRHTACAFAIATVFIPFCWFLSLPLYLLGCLLAYTRFALGWHYPTDLFGGGLIGTLCGLIVLI